MPCYAWHVRSHCSICVVSLACVHRPEAKSHRRTRPCASKNGLAILVWGLLISQHVSAKYRPAIRVMPYAAVLVYLSMPCSPHATDASYAQMFEQAPARLTLGPRSRKSPSRTPGTCQLACGSTYLSLLCGNTVCNIMPAGQMLSHKVESHCPGAEGQKL